eukprot:scaffold3350_cov78-Skeletonema_dohrnii-CCMP3373.AAC.5
MTSIIQLVYLLLNFLVIPLQYMSKQTLEVLEHLGETFPATPENGIIVQEMLGNKDLVTVGYGRTKTSCRSRIKNHPTFLVAESVHFDLLAQLYPSSKLSLRHENVAPLLGKRRDEFIKFTYISRVNCHIY